MYKCRNTLTSLIDIPTNYIELEARSQSWNFCIRLVRQPSNSCTPLDWPVEKFTLRCAPLSFLYFRPLGLTLCLSWFSRCGLRPPPWGAILSGISTNSSKAKHTRWHSVWIQFKISLCCWVGTITNLREIQGALALQKLWRLWMLYSVRQYLDWLNLVLRTRTESILALPVA